jgi:Ca-activated chloride channel family protein
MAYIMMFLLKALSYVFLSLFVVAVFFAAFFNVGFAIAAGSTGIEANVGADADPDADPDADVTLSPYFFVENAGAPDGSAERFPLKETYVTSNINGAIAEIFLIQVYSNEGAAPINAGYIFPASTRVTVHGMVMEIGDNRVTAQIKEREEAKEVYEQAKSAGKSASLLEQQRPNVFSMKVANIMPGDNVRIELHYTELIAATGGVYQFDFPTVVGPRYSNQAAAGAPDTERFIQSAYLKEGTTAPGIYDITVNLTAGVPITELRCKSHDVNVEWAGEKAAKIKLAGAPHDYAGNRDYILEYRLTGEEPACGLMLLESEGGPENFFMLTIQPPARVDAAAIPPREYIFVLDVSGSMYGYPLDTAKSLIKNLLDGLNHTDSFNILLFSGASELLSPVSLPADAANIEKAIRLIESQDGGGGTELLPALERAVAIPRPVPYTTARSVVVITDGYIQEEYGAFDIISKNIGDMSFFSFGIGTSVNRFLIEGVAKAGLGEPFVVTDERDAEDAAARFREYIQSPVLTDINVRFEGFGVYDVTPEKQPALFALRPVVVYGKWNGAKAGTIHVTGKNASKEYMWNIDVAETETRESNTALRYLWARSKADMITGCGFLREMPDAAKKELTELGLKYSMMTPFTSFVAVAEKIRNVGGAQTLDVDQPLPLPLHVSNLAVGRGYAIGSEPGLPAMLPCIAILSMAYLLLRAKKTYKPRRVNARTIGK